MLTTMLYAAVLVFAVSSQQQTPSQNRHAGVAGKERADRLAGSATIGDGQQMDHTDIINTLKEMGRAEDFENNESTSLDRMMELGIRFALELDRNCFPEYVTPGSPCTCKKTSPQTEGLVQWTFSNGTVANQTSDPDNGTATLVVEPSFKYALNQSYICQTVVGQDKKGFNLTYNAQFMFGPESASLTWAEEPKGTIYLCPSTNETQELRLRCEVPSNTVNPRPVYTVLIDGNRYGGYDRLGGQLVEADKVWRLDINFKLNNEGNHTAVCHVRNMYYGANWFVLEQNIIVSDQVPSSFKC